PRPLRPPEPRPREDRRALARAAGHARLSLHVQPAAPEGVVDRRLARVVLGGVRARRPAGRPPRRRPDGGAREDRRAASAAEASHRSPRTARRRHRDRGRRGVRRPEGPPRDGALSKRRDQDVGRAELLEPTLSVQEPPRLSAPDLRGVRTGPVVLGHRYHPHAVLVPTVRDDVHRGDAVAQGPRPRARDGRRRGRLARLEAARRTRMITQFGSLFAGHVDLDNEGLDGTAANDRWLPDDELAGVFPKSDAIAKLMDRTGYDTFWLAEHHFQREGYECIPNILMLAIHLCHITKHIKIGCGFNIAPMWHPLRMAEDYATADWLTGGRVVFGVGRGYHTREVEVFGSPLRDQDANRELFEEQVDVIFKSFNQRAFSHQGKYYTIPPPQVPYRGYELRDISLVPRPKTLPVECWQPVVSASQRALDFMARHNINGIIGGGAPQGGAHGKGGHAFREARAPPRPRTHPGGDLCLRLRFSFYIADSVEQGIKEATPFFEENIKMFAPLGFVPGLTPEQIDAVADPKRARQAGLPTLRNAIKAGTWLIGPPEQITEQLKDIEHKYPGLEVVNVGQPVGTPQKVILEQLERFAAQVMPAFKKK